MIRRGYSFEFDLPEGWQDESGGGQLVAHGPNGEELIVSGSLVTGQGDPAALLDVRRQLLENAFEAVRDAASVPELVITKPLTREDGLSSCECWILHGHTTDGDLFFGEAVVASDAGVMIATLEAPHEPTAAALFAEFVKSVRRATTH